jgi:hypothetical protein
LVEWRSSYKSREADTGYAKFFIQEDLEHVLHAIIEVLDEHLPWPDENSRHELATVYPGTMKGCIGVGDVKRICNRGTRRFCQGENALEWKGKN